MAKLPAEEKNTMGLSGTLPRHVAIIMDGNGRWAQKRMMPRVFGHRAGMDRLRDVIRLSSDLGIEALSLYAFSTENWKRPQDEINALCGLLVEYFYKEIEELHENNVNIRILGELVKFPQSVQEAAASAMEKTKNNTGLHLNIALNYGAQDEILRAIRMIAQDVEAGACAPEEIDDGLFSRKLDTSGLPDVDFLIRTGGEQRLSNFLLYQAAYAELYFTDTYWPDFKTDAYKEALRVYQTRIRRYGGLS